jgi:uncharacterized membrane protein
MTRYELLKFLHVGSAIVWLGAGTLIFVMLGAAKRTKDNQTLAMVYRQVGWLSPRLFIPASLATFIFGIIAGIDGDWDFGEYWITVGFIGYLASFGVGIGFFKPEGGRLAELFQTKGPDDPEIAVRSDRMHEIERAQLVVLFLVVADMVAKPTSDNSVAVIISSIILAAGLLYGIAMLVRKPQVG